MRHRTSIHSRNFLLMTPGHEGKLYRFVFMICFSYNYSHTLTRFHARIKYKLKKDRYIIIKYSYIYIKTYLSNNDCINFSLSYPFLI